MLRGKAGAGHSNHAHLSAVQENVIREVTTVVMCVCLFWCEDNALVCVLLMASM